MGILRSVNEIRLRFTLVANIVNIFLNVKFSREKFIMFS